MGRLRQSGFTLIEVSLAIVIGVVLLAGAITLYNQVKFSAGTAKMQEKVLAMTTVIEEFGARAGRYPNAKVWNDYEIAGLYKAKRPNDYLASPWGGPVGSDLRNANEGIGHWYQPAGDLGDAGTNTMVDSGLHYAGGLQYWEVNGATASLWDKSRNGRVTYRFYSVHGVAPNNDDGWFVMGGK